jgi:hypothetical protein
VPISGTLPVAPEDRLVVDSTPITSADFEARSQVVIHDRGYRFPIPALGTVAVGGFAYIDQNPPGRIGGVGVNILDDAELPLLSTELFFGFCFVGPFR